MFEPIFVKARCKGCGFCVEFCPRKVLFLSEEMNSLGYHFASVADLELIDRVVTGAPATGGKIDNSPLPIATKATKTIRMAEMFRTTVSPSIVPLLIASIAES